MHPLKLDPIQKEIMIETAQARKHLEVLMRDSFRMPNNVVRGNPSEHWYMADLNGVKAIPIKDIMKDPNEPVREKTTG